MNIDVSSVPEFKTPNYVSPLMEGLQSAMGVTQAGTDIYKNILANRIQAAKAQYADPMALAELQKAQAEPGLVNAQTNQANSSANWNNTDAQRLKSLLPYFPQEMQAGIAEKLAQAQLLGMGGRNAGTGQKEEMFFQSLVGRDNPQLKPEQIYEASNVLRQGGNQLSDGTPIKALSPASQTSYDRLTKGSTSTALITQGVKANQAETELKVLDAYTTPKVSVYGDTYFGKSPAQISDSFKNDEASQTRLGQFMGAQALQYEAAQIRNRMAGGEAGITATQELMGKSGQVIDKFAPKLSAKARQIAMETIDDGLGKALAARRSVPIGASSLSLPQNENRSAQQQAPASQSSSQAPEVTKRWIRVNGKLVRSPA